MVSFVLPEGTDCAFFRAHRNLQFPVETHERCIVV